MRYLSLFSGIEAASAAWLPLGWECAAVAEIEPFPCHALKHHYPDVPNLGDITKITESDIAALGHIDLVVGGFPCQDVSVAGKRAGLKNDDGSATRSGLFFTAMRISEWTNARWVVIENVPGLFSNHAGGDFAAVVAEMAGCQFDVPRDGWRNAGVALGPRGLVEWTVLDAQYHGLAQRRRRVFLVRDSGDWASRQPLFLESYRLQGHPAPRREAGQGIARPIAAGSKRGSGYRNDADTADNLLAFGGNNCSGPISAAAAVNAKGGAGRMDFESATFIAHSLRGEGFDASEDGTGRGTPLVPVCFSAKDHGADAMSDLSPTLRDGGHSGSHANAGVMPAIAFNARQDPDSWTERSGPLDTDGATQAIAFAQNQRDEVRLMDVAGALASEPGMKQQTYANVGMRVRRLTPMECERLQDFPDGYTRIPIRTYKIRRITTLRPADRWERNADGTWTLMAADGPRYKALGNSMAVPCMRWIGQRIEAAAQHKGDA